MSPHTVDPEDAVAIDIALTKLQAMDPGQAGIVELRLFRGLSVEETAEVLSTSSTPSSGNGLSPARGCTGN